MSGPCPLGTCEHPQFSHDWEEPGVRPMCCVDGCPCGKGAVQAPEPTSRTLPVVWPETAIHGAVQRASDVVAGRPATVKGAVAGIATMDLACLVDVAHAFMATKNVVLPDALRRRLDHAYAAAHLGVSWEPGNPESSGGLSKDEALREAAAFLVALYDAVTEAESGEVSS